MGNVAEAIGLIERETRGGGGEFGLNPRRKLGRLMTQGDFAESSIMIPARQYLQHLPLTAQGNRANDLARHPGLRRDDGFGYVNSVHPIALPHGCHTRGISAGVRW